MSVVSKPMIDLHSHILPGIDDGATDMVQSLEMARIYEDVGFRQVVATPHWMPGTSWVPAPLDIRKKVAALNRAIKGQGIALTVYPGMEISLDVEIPRFLKDQRLQPLAGGAFLLIELPFQWLPVGWEEILFRVLANGYRVLLAHPERCGPLAENTDRFEEQT